MISKKTFQFLKDLKSNNTRDWFQDNKPRFLESKEDFESFIGNLIPVISKFDPSVSQLDPKKCVFRIYRDTRFSKDKTPYKTNMGAHLLAKGRMAEHSSAGYYVHLEPGNSFLAGGAYLPPAPWLKAIRQEIDYNTQEFKKILNNATFKKYFGAMEGEQLKTAPKGYPKDHPEIELLRYKSFLASHHVKDKDVQSSDFLSYTGKVFKALHPFDQFLNRAME